MLFVVLMRLALLNCAHWKGNMSTHEWGGKQLGVWLQQDFPFLLYAFWPTEIITSLLDWQYVK